MYSSERRIWTREEIMLAFELYCIIPKGKDTVNNKQIIALSTAINRSVNSIKLKIQNFKSYDPSYTQNGRVGLSHGSKLDKEVCDEFLNNWNSLVVETNEIKNGLNLPHGDLTINKPQDVFLGRSAIREQNTRIGQAFFRKALLAAYNYRCCFSGISFPELLRASHIKPWAESEDLNEKTNPQNGLLLNALHDLAFDKGLMTITTDYEILVSSKILNGSSDNKRHFENYHRKKMLLPSRFFPDKEFISYHNEKFMK